MLTIALTAFASLAVQDDHGYAEQAILLDDETRYAYRLLAPARVVEGETYPLLVFLHGAGERGDDNLAQLVHLPDRLATDAYRGLFDGFVLAPQCRTGQRWVETDWSAETSTPMTPQPYPMLAAAMRALDEVLAEHPIDTARVVLTGLSMGGYGTWELATRRNGDFAAVVPICGGGDERHAVRLAGIPLWAWHGDQDGAVPVRRSRDMIAAIRAAGGSPRYTELPGTGHFAWPVAYAPDSPLWPWLAQQRRGRPDPTQPAGSSSVGAGSPETLTLGRTRLTSLTFEADVEGPHTVSAHRYWITDGGEVCYRAAPGAANQLVMGNMAFEGDAVLRNDNDWTHFADMLRFRDPFVGGGTVTIRGDGLGGVEVPRECYSSFSGRFVVESGRLVLSHAWTSRDVHPIELRGGDVLVRGGFDVTTDFHVTGDAGLLTAGRTALLGALRIDAEKRFVLDTGGGNRLDLRGTLEGPGTLVLRGARSEVPRGTSFLGNEQETPFTGALHVERGSVRLAYTRPGIVGDVVLGSDGPGFLTIAAPDQLRDDALFTAREGSIEQQTIDETYGVLDLRGDLELAFPEERPSPATATFRISSDHLPAEGAQLILRGLVQDGDAVRLAAADDAVDWQAVLPYIGLRVSGAVHRAERRADGRLVVGERVEPVGPYPLHDPDRRALYTTRGLEQLGAADSPLTNDAVISFFGDSITWTGDYTSRIARALRSGPGTARGTYRLHNRGINGGGVLEILNGSPDNARRGTSGSAPQAPFADVLRADGTTLAVVFIGINDLWWRGTSLADYEAALTALARQSQAAGVALVLATPWLIQELPDGSGPKDAEIERFAAVVRKVAATWEAPLVDLRAAAIAWLRDHNTELRLDGSYEHRQRGLLTTDGVHATATGHELLAELIANGIRAALER